MCLLHTHPADTPFDQEDIEDFYSHNRDGVGVMWAENEVLYTMKHLPKDKEDAWDFYRKNIQGRECVVHWRMKTHGLIDMINCHPYTVFGEGSVMPLSIMHNGILSTGNSKDLSKSDTWHYVQDYLVPLLEDNPELLLKPAFQELIADHIGHGNRFVLMNHLGDMAVINSNDFVTYKGALLSNTYAWDSSKGGFGAKSYYTSPRTGGFGSQYTAWDDEDRYYPNPAPSTAKQSAQVFEHTFKQASIWPDADDTPAAEYMLPANFFLMLSSGYYDKAHAVLSFADVSQCIESVGQETWLEFCERVESDEFFTDQQIIDAVRDPELLYDWLLDIEEELADEVAEHVALRSVA